MHVRRCRSISIVLVLPPLLRTLSSEKQEEHTPRFHAPSTLVARLWCSCMANVSCVLRSIDDVARARIVHFGSILQFVHVRSEPWRKGVQTRKRRRDQQAWRWEVRTVAHVRRTTRHLEGKMRGDGTGTRAMNEVDASEEARTHVGSEERSVESCSNKLGCGE